MKQTDILAYVEARQKGFNEEFRLYEKSVKKPNSKRLEDIYERVVK